MNTVAPNNLVIYSIVDSLEPDRVRYIGLTRRGLATRSKSHISSSRTTPAKLPIYKWMQKRDDFRVQFGIIEVCATEAELRAAESKWIKHYRNMGMCDLNVTDGGESMSGYRHSEEFKRNQSIRMSERNKRNWQTPEYRQKMKSVNPKAGAGNLGGKKKNPINFAQKLTPDMVRQIRVHISEGKLSLVAIARIYGVAVNSIWSIKHGKSWAWLE